MESERGTFEISCEKCLKYLLKSRNMKFYCKKMVQLLSGWVAPASDSVDKSVSNQFIKEFLNKNKKNKLLNNSPSHTTASSSAQGDSVSSSISERGGLSLELCYTCLFFKQTVF